MRHVECHATMEVMLSMGAAVEGEGRGGRGRGSGASLMTGRKPAPYFSPFLHK